MNLLCCQRISSRQAHTPPVRPPISPPSRDVSFVTVRSCWLDLDAGCRKLAKGLCRYLLGVDQRPPINMPSTMSPRITPAVSHLDVLLGPPTGVGASPGRSSRWRMDSPEPGMPRLRCVPRRPVVTLAPFTPAETLMPDPLRFTRIPGTILIDFRNRSAMAVPSLANIRAAPHEPRTLRRWTDLYRRSARSPFPLWAAGIIPLSRQVKLHTLTPL